MCIRDRAANFGIILVVIALSYLVGAPVYTYDYPDRKIGRAHV